MNPSNTAASTYITTLDRPAPLPVQPAESFKCPSWCIEQHSSADLSEWDDGLWIVRHEGAYRTWLTSRDTEMRARLVFAEIVGRSPVDADTFYTGPYVELGGDDGSGYTGVCEIDAADMTAWGSVLLNFHADLLG